MLPPPGRGGDGGIHIDQDIQIVGYPGFFVYIHI